MLKKIWGFFISIRLTILLLIILSAVCVIGTVVPQNSAEHEYLHLYKQSTYQLLKSLGITDLYHCWWFIATLGLFTLNLTACTLNRLPGFGRLLKPIDPAPDEARLQAMTNTRKFSIKKPVPDTAERMAQAVGKALGSPTVTRRGGTTYIAAEKGRFSYLAFYFTHAGMIAVIAGVLIGTIGFQGYMQIDQGEAQGVVMLKNSDEQRDLGFSIRCDRFEVTYYDNARMPQDYKSWLTVIDGGREVVKKVIEVNDPLIYKGIYFYQSSYGASSKGRGEVLLRIAPAEAPGRAKEYRVQTGKRFVIEGTQDEAVVETVLPDFAMEEGRYFSRSGEPNNPAAKVTFYRKGGQTESSWVFAKFADFHNKPGAAYSVQMADYVPAYYTGLQVTRDPGVNIVWLGCILLIGGICAAFFLSHRRVWLVLQEKDGSLRALLAGSANKNRPAFEADFNRLYERLKSLEKQS